VSCGIPPALYGEAAPQSLTLDVAMCKVAEKGRLAAEAGVRVVPGRCPL
jgi:hypothetical protein